MKKQSKETFKKPYIVYVLDSIIEKCKLLKRQVVNDAIVIKTLDDIIIEYNNLLEVIENIQEQLEKERGKK